jgi:N-methylhydantoinase B
MAREGLRSVQRAMRELQAYAERLMRHMLKRLRPGTYRAVDYLEDDGAGTTDIRIAVRVRLGGGDATVDFTGSAVQADGGVNANLAVTLAATVYVFRALADLPVPANAGMMRPIHLQAPLGTVVNARFPAAVAGGNVETSQRIVDVLLRALAPAAPDRVPAASCGSMNNLAFGGYDRAHERAFSYYETICGGAGAGPRRAGLSAVHTHMTNTLNTPIEALEGELPVRVNQYRVRPRSGGRGRHAGGDGVVRELEFLSSADVTLLTERRRRRPYALNQGGEGVPGQNTLLSDGKTLRLPAKITLRVGKGGRLRVATPGGGAWGARKRRH